MTTYVFQHDMPSEPDRMDLMSSVLDDVSRNHLKKLPIQTDWNCLEVGAGNGSLSKWLSPMLTEGHVLATDINPDLIGVPSSPNMSVQALNIVSDTMEKASYDLIFLRAVLHHIEERELALSKLVSALRPGGWLFLHEPDLHPSISTMDEGVRRFWAEFFDWAAKAGLDYAVGAKIPRMLTSQGLQNTSAWGDTAVYAGGTPYAEWLRVTISELADRLVADKATTRAMLDHFDAASRDPDCWHMSVSFVGTIAQKPAP